MDPQPAQHAPTSQPLSPQTDPWQTHEAPPSSRLSEQEKHLRLVGIGTGDTTAPRISPSAKAGAAATHRLEQRLLGRAWLGCLLLSHLSVWAQGVPGAGDC